MTSCPRYAWPTCRAALFFWAQQSKRNIWFTAVVIWNGENWKVIFPTFTWGHHTTCRTLQWTQYEERPQSGTDRGRLLIVGSLYPFCVLVWILPDKNQKIAMLLKKQYKWQTAGFFGSFSVKRFCDRLHLLIWFFCSPWTLLTSFKWNQFIRFKKQTNKLVFIFLYLVISQTR